MNGPKAGNPIANAFVVIVGVLAIAASVVLGFFAFIVIGSLVLILGSVIAVRVWWLQRKIRSSLAEQQTQADRASDAIEGEYHVVADDEKGA